MLKLRHLRKHMFMLTKKKLFQAASLFGLFAVLIISVFAFTNFSTQYLGTKSSAQTSPSSQTSPSLLPGQQIWKNGISSYLFGSNDSEDWNPDNFVTDPHHIIQSSLKSGGLTLMREFIFHYSLRDGHRTTLGTTPQMQLNTTNPHEFDQPSAQYTYVTPNQPYRYELETRLRAIENSGMQCLIVLPNILTDPANNVDPDPSHKRITDPDTRQLETDLDFDRKVVAYAGNRCNMYEFGNESDLHGIKIDTYLARWNEFVPILRKINPNAKFFGPVTYNDQGNNCTYTPQGTSCYMRDFLKGVKASRILPDGITFHWYPCSGTDKNACLAAADTYTQVINEVRGWMQSDLGFTLPLGITEWNMDPGSNNALGDDPVFMNQFTTKVLNNMAAAHLDFANQYDTQDYGGDGALDMFDINNNDQPKAQFNAIVALVKHYKLNITPTSTPSATIAPGSILLIHFVLMVKWFRRRPSESQILEGGRECKQSGIIS